MRERNRIRLKCKDCVWYRKGKNAERCFVESNLSTNWLGVVYMKHPDWKNYNDACIDYEKKGKKNEEC